MGGKRRVGESKRIKWSEERKCRVGERGGKWEGGGESEGSGEMAREM